MHVFVSSLVLLLRPPARSRACRLHVFFPSARSIDSSVWRNKDKAFPAQDTKCGPGGRRAAKAKRKAISLARLVTH